MTVPLPDHDPPPGFRWAALVPELVVSDLARSLDFWVETLGFAIAYARPEERFAYLHRGSAQIMLEQHEAGMQWITGALEPPLGRGMNLQIEIDDCDAVLSRLGDAGWALFRPPAERWYRAGAREVGQRQFLVQDPDGYLVRMQQPLGNRPFSRGGADT